MSDDYSSFSDSSEEDNQQTPETSNHNVNEEERLAYGEILSKVTADHVEFTPVKEPGNIQVQHLDPDKELYLFMIPKDTINPLSLVNSEVVIGGRKEKDLSVKDEKCKLVTYESFSTPDTPSLFLPDEMGELHKVNFEIKGRVVLKGQTKILPNNSVIDIDTLRSVHHKPPVDIKERNFLNNAGKRSRECSPKRRAVGMELYQSIPKILKKKKKRKRDSTENCDDKIQVENEHLLDLDLYTPDSDKKKQKKSKKDKNESLDLSEETFQFNEDFTLDSPRKKKRKT